jgi:tetratricopeptide (TPR) repeat protein
MSRRARSTRRVSLPVPSVAAAPWPASSRWIALGLAMLACLIYASSWRYGFVGDDSRVILGNAWTTEGLAALPRIVSHSLYFGSVPLNGGLYRPVAGAYYAIVGALVDLRAPGYHLAQLALYGVNIATAFLFLTRVSRTSVAAPLVATLLFLVHPIHTEVVNNIKSADEMLCLEFFLLSAIAWLQFADTANGRWRVVSLAAYALAVGSKETAAPMVIVLPALWYFFRDRDIARSLRAAIPFALIAAAFLALRQSILDHEPPTNIVTILNNALVGITDRSSQVATALAYLGRYARMLFWPHPLSFDYTFSALPAHTFQDPWVWLSIALIVGLGAVFVAGFRSRRVEAFAVLWCGAAMIAVSNVFFLISTNFGERLLYLPSLMACYIAAVWLLKAARIDSADEVKWSLSAVVRSPKIAVPLVVVLVICTGATLRRTREWRDQITLFKADVKKFPNSARLQNYFGNLLYFEGERLLEQPDYTDIAKADLSGAKRHLTRGLEILNSFQDMHAVLGMAEYKLRDCTGAIPHLKQALAFPAFRDAALAMTAECYKQLGQPDQATAVFEELDAEGVESPLTWFELGNAATARGDDDASIRFFSKFLAVKPDNIAAHFNLAQAFRKKGEFPQSLAEADRCVALQPTPQVEANCLLLGADALMHVGRADEAMRRFQRAQMLDPNNPWIKK